MSADIDKIVEQMQEDWDKPFVRLIEVYRASKGLRAYNTVRNKHLAGTGPRNTFKIGINVAWPKEDFFQWLREQMR